MLSKVTTSNVAFVEWLKPEGIHVWDHFVEQHPFGLVYHLSDWLRALDATFPQIKSRILVLKDNINKQILAGLPLSEVNSWLLGKRLVSIPFASTADPLISSAGQFDILFDAIKHIYISERFKRVELRVLKAMDFVDGCDLNICKPFKHHFLHLTEDPDQTFTRIHKMTQRNIKRASQKKIVVCSDLTETNLGLFYDLFCQTRRRLSLPAFPIKFFTSIRKSMGPSRFKLRLAMLNETPVAGLGILCSKDFWAVEFVGDRAEYRNERANQYLFWQVINEACREGISNFSFGRTSINNVGLLEYKRNWGMEEEDLSICTYPASNSLEIEDREESFSYRLVQAISHYSPMPVYQWFSRFCYRHLG